MYHEHIDTLYLNYKCVSLLEYNSILLMCVSDDAKFLGHSSSRYWYSFPSFRLGVYDDYDKCFSANQYHCVIQYEHNDLFSHKPFELLNSLFLPFDLDLNRYIIKRIDYNITFKSNDFDFYDSGYISKYFRGIWKKPYDSTIYLGDRAKSKKIFRIYDKKKELLDNKSSLKYDMLMQYFDSNIDNLITCEVEIQRDYIRDHINVGNGSLNFFKEIVHDAKSILSSIEVFPYNDYNKIQYKNNNYKRLIDKVFLVNVCRTKPILKKQFNYVPKVINLAKRMLSLKDDFSTRLGRDISNEELIMLMTDIESDGTIIDYSFEYDKY